MKKVLAIAVALGALGASQVFAQAKSFEGFNVGANAEINHATMSASDGSSGSDHSAGLGLQANYNWALGDQFVLGLGAGLSTGHHDAGTYASGSNASVKDRYSIDLMPGYAINNSLLVYGKLSARLGHSVVDRRCQYGDGAWHRLRRRSAWLDQQPDLLAGGSGHVPLQ